MDHSYLHKIIKYNTWCSVKILENYSTRLAHVFKRISSDNFRDPFKPIPPLPAAEEEVQTGKKHTWSMNSELRVVLGAVQHNKE